jgi:hypothetical protein
MLPSLGLGCDFGVLIECSGTLLNFYPYSTFHPYLLHSGTSSASNHEDYICVAQLHEGFIVSGLF